LPVWTGYGHGTRCDGCGQSIQPAQVECEVRMDQDSDRVLRLHIGCMGMWLAELRRRGLVKREDDGSSGSTPGGSGAMMSELRNFVSRHRAHGPLTADATEPTAKGYLLTVRCPCGVDFMRWVTPSEATRELVLSTLLASES
jgi:hypothetical protein